MTIKPFLEGSPATSSGHYASLELVETLDSLTSLAEQAAEGTIPAAGTAGDVLVKASGDDFDAAWQALGISDVTGLQAELDGKLDLTGGTITGDVTLSDGTFYADGGTTSFLRARTRVLIGDAYDFDGNTQGNNSNTNFLLDPTIFDGSGTREWMLSNTYLSVIAEAGGVPILGAGIADEANGRAQGYGGIFFALNDTPLSEPGNARAYGQYIEAVRSPACDTARGFELNVINRGASPKASDPQPGILPNRGGFFGMTLGAHIASGGGAGEFATVEPADCALMVAPNASSFWTGISFLDGSLEPWGDSRARAILMKRLDRVSWFDVADNEVFAVDVTASGATKAQVLEFNDAGMSLQNDVGNAVFFVNNGADSSEPNYVAVTAVDGGAPIMAAAGPDADIDLELRPKGSGVVVATGGLVADNTPQTFPTRADLVTWVGSNTPVDGKVYSAGGYDYIGLTGATDISDLPGLVPFGDVWLEHFGVVTSASKGAPTTDYTSEVQAAMDYTRGTLHFSGWVKITDKVTCPNTCTLHCPAGRTYGGFSIFSDFSGAATCVLQPGTSEAGATIGHLGMWFEQPSAPANRAALNSYPPAIDIGTTAIPRGYIEALRIEQATDGIKGVGNCGGYRFGILELGCFGDNLHIDGALDFVHADSIHVWPFGFSGNSDLTDIFYDGTTSALTLGRVDGWMCDKFGTFRAGVTIDRGSSGILPYHFGSVGLDGDGATATFTDGDIFIGRLYSTKTGAPTGATVTVDGARVRIAQFGGGGGEDGDTIRVTSGECYITGGHIKNTDNAQNAATVSGGVLDISNTVFEWNNAARSAAFIAQSGTGILRIRDCAPSHYTNAATVISIGADVEGNWIDARSLHPHAVSLSGSEPYEGRYFLNTSSYYSGSAQLLDSRVVAHDSQEGPELQLKRSRGSIASPSAVSAGDNLGDIAFFGWDGNSFEPAARIRALAQGTISDGIVQGRLQFLCDDSSGTTRVPLTVDPSAVTVTNGNMNISSGTYRVGGTQVVGSQQSAISDVPTGGSATVGDNATAINSILSALRTHGLIAT